MNLKHLVAALYLLSIAGGTGEAGTIKGNISAEVKSQNSPGANGNSYGSRKYKFLEQVDYSSFRHFVVSIADVEAIDRTGDTPRATVEQKDGQFVPRVLPVAAGTTVQWPNRDSVSHFGGSPFRPGLLQKQG